MSAYVEDTIAAIATPAGQGAICILRLSGREARAVAARILRTTPGGAPLPTDDLDSHRARRARLVRPGDAHPIDEVVVVPMWAPRSYSGEDTVEIHAHGGRVIADLALRAALAAGARPARAGEFTERAYLNGRMDLCQAEGVADMIEAGSEAALDAARRHLEGDLSDRVLAERDRILDVRGLVEAHLDFPEDDLPEGVEQELVESIASTRSSIERLAATFARGRLVRDGVRVVLVGKPNVGKSCLLNALLGRERALVSSEAGTTRDYLEEPLAIGSLQVLLCDTAGLRQAAHHVERAGVERSKERIENADVLVIVLDGSQPLDQADRDLLAAEDGRPRVVVRNKCDLGAAWDDDEAGGGSLAVSATERLGLEELVEALERAVPESKASEDGLLVTNARHHEALVGSAAHLGHSGELLRANRELELVAAELQAACAALDGLVGRSDCEDVLDRVFSRFCVGK